MKKLCRKGTVHPSPPIISDHLSFLPAAILTLTAALSPEEREVLAYLISCSNNSSSSSSFQGHRKSTQQPKNGIVSFATIKSTGNNINNNDHPPQFTCDCFRCYMSYWVKWDASPNRQLIHEIIDAFEDHEMLHTNKKAKNNKKDKKKRITGNDHNKNDHHHQLKDQQLLAAESEPVEGNRDDDGANDHEGCNNKGEGEEKDSVRSFVSYIGERIWSVWG